MPTSKTLPVLALLAWAAPLAAQEAIPAEEPAAETPAEAPEAPAEAVTDDPAAAPEEEPAEGAEEAPAEGAEEGAEVEDSGPQLSMGEPVGEGSGEPAVGENYAAAEHGDWTQVCLRTESGVDPCQLTQLLRDQDGNAVAQVSILALPPGREAAAGAEIVAPLETLLTEELTLSVDGTSARRYPFSYCNGGGCVAVIGFRAEEIEQFKRGSSGTVELVPAAAPDQTVTLTLSLSGFTAGYDALVANLAEVAAAAGE